LQLSSDGSLTLEMPADAIITLTTLHGASKQGIQKQIDKKNSILLNQIRDPPAASFPLPYTESFDEQGSEHMPRFFADQGGAFEVVNSAGVNEPVTPGDQNGTAKTALQPFHRNKVLQQQVVTPPIAWIGHSPEPLTLIGDVNWTDITAKVITKLGGPVSSSRSSSSGSAAPRHAGLCVRLSRYHFFGGAQSAPEGYCLRITESPTPRWTFTAAGEALADGLLGSEAARRVTTNEWLELQITALGANLNAWVNGQQVFGVKNTMLPFGQVALECGYHKCQFDDLRITGEQPHAKAQTSLHRTLVSRAQLAQFDYNGRTCDPAPRLARRRRDFTGFAGFGFVPQRALIVKGLGRLEVSGGHPWARIHNVSLYSSENMTLLASVALPSEATNQIGIEETADGWTFAAFREPLQLLPGTEYYIVSSELANGDAFYDRSVRVDADSDIEVRGPVYFDNTGWHRYLEPRQVYGPLNAWIEVDPQIVSSPLNKSLQDFGRRIGNAFPAQANNTEKHGTGHSHEESSVIVKALKALASLDAAIASVDAEAPSMAALMPEVANQAFFANIPEVRSFQWAQNSLHAKASHMFRSCLALFACLATLA